MKIKQDSCPLCQSKDFFPFIKVKDYNVSHDIFDLCKCKSCDLIFTNDIPTEENIGDYYKFANYVSHTDTKESLFYKVYHKVRSIMLYVKFRWIVSQNVVEKNILDIGSGTGAFLAYFRRKGWSTRGIEIDSNARENAMKINNVESSAPSEFYKLSEKFSVITLWHVLEHLHDLDGYLKKIKQLLDQKGILLIAVPNPTCFEAQYYKEYWDGYDVPRHLYHFSPKSIAYLIDKYDFQMISMKRMWFDSIYSGLLSEKHQKGFKIRGVIIGLISNILALFNREKAGSITYIIKHK